MNVGVPAPVARNTAENPHSPSISSTVAVRPTTKFVVISTPSALIRSVSTSRISFGRRNSGIPYLSTPPTA